MGDILAPKPMKTGQQKAGDVWSDILTHFMTQGTGGAGGAGVTGGTDLSKYGGIFKPGAVPQGAGRATGDANIGEFINRVFSLPGYEGDMTAGATPLQTAATGHGEKALEDFFSAGGAWDTISKHATDELASGGGMSLDDVYTSLDAQRRQGLTRDLGQLEEEFGIAGLSDSTGLYESAARRQTESEQGLQAEVARIAPQLLDATTNRTLGLSGLLAGLPMQVAQAGFNLGEGGREIQDLELQRLYQDFLRQQSLFPQILQFLGSGGPVDYAPSDVEQLTKLGLTGVSLLG